VDELKNWQDDYGFRDFINSLRNKVIPQAEQDLLDLAESEISDLNFTQNTLLIKEQIILLDLDSFIQGLQQVKQRLGTSTKERNIRLVIGNQILVLENMKQVLNIYGWHSYVRHIFPYVRKMFCCHMSAIFSQMSAIYRGHLGKNGEPIYDLGHMHMGI
jgi:hypothetical protein